MSTKMSNDDLRTKQFQFLQKYLNSARKETRSEHDRDKDKPAAASEAKKDDDWLTKKALEELQRDITINKVKRKAFGSVTAPKAKANKRFLQATLTQCLSHNKREITRHQAKSTDKLKELDRTQRLRNSTKKFGERKHEYKKPDKKKKKKKKRRRSSSSSSSTE